MTVTIRGLGISLIVGLLLSGCASPTTAQLSVSPTTPKGPSVNTAPITPAASLASLRHLLDASTPAYAEFWGFSGVYSVDTYGGNASSSYSLSGDGSVQPIDLQWNYGERWMQQCYSNGNCYNYVGYGRTSNYNTKYAYQVPQDKFLVINYLSSITVYSGPGYYSSNESSVVLNGTSITPGSYFSQGSSSTAPTQHQINFVFNPGSIIVIQLLSSTNVTLAGYTANAAFLTGSGSSVNPASSK